MGVPPNHPVVMDDHDLVLQPMVTWGCPMTIEPPYNPIWRFPKMVVLVPPNQSKSIQIIHFDC